jgi:hypothetical protein
MAMGADALLDITQALLPLFVASCAQNIVTCRRRLTRGGRPARSPPKGLSPVISAGRAGRTQQGRRPPVVAGPEGRHPKGAEAPHRYAI